VGQTPRLRATPWSRFLSQSNQGRASEPGPTGASAADQGVRPTDSTRLRINGLSVFTSVNPQFKIVFSELFGHPARGLGQA
jgi:hypothetical protein